MTATARPYRHFFHVPVGIASSVTRDISSACETALKFRLARRSRRETIFFDDDDNSSSLFSLMVTEFGLESLSLFATSASAHSFFNLVPRRTLFG
jgi:hypothetical protein